MRWIRNEFWFLIGLAVAMIVFTPGAWAVGKPDNRPPDNRPPDINVRGGADATADSSAISGAHAGALAGALAVGGPATATGHGGQGGAGGDAAAHVEGITAGGGEGGQGGAAQAASSNDGNSYRTSNSNFYVSRSLPPSANPCIVSADGGGGGDGGAGFLGFQWISGKCWADKLAEQERNADLKARLKCGDGQRQFRRSVAFDAPKGTDKQAYCVNYVKAIYLAEIQMEHDQVQAAREHALELLRAELEGESSPGN